MINRAELVDQCAELANASNALLILARSENFESLRIALDAVEKWVSTIERDFQALEVERKQRRIKNDRRIQSFFLAASQREEGDR